MIRKIALPAMLLAALDLAIKLLPLGEERTLIPGFLGLTSASNRGVAFGMLSGSPLINALLIGLVIILASIWLIKNPPAIFQAAGAALLLGGAAGNLLDRLLHGAVSDYLVFEFMAFPVFNLADVFLTVGAALLILDLLLPRKKENE
jgi:signal peptidase II